MLQARQATVGECTSIIAAQGETARKTAERQQEMLQACVDELGRLPKLTVSGTKDWVALQADLAAELRQMQAAIDGLPEWLDGILPEHLAGVPHLLRG